MYIIGMCFLLSHDITRIRPGFGTAPLNAASEAAALALVRFLVASVSSSSSSRGAQAHLARTLPYALSLLLALPFLRWRSTDASSGASAGTESAAATGASGRCRRRRCVRFASALTSGLLELASAAASTSSSFSSPSSSSSPSSLSRVRVCVLRALGMLHRQCAHMTRQLPALRPARVTVVTADAAAAESSSTASAGANGSTQVEVWRFDADAAMAMPTSPTLLQAPFVLLGAYARACVSVIGFFIF